jgi:hypothetical protein
VRDFAEKKSLLSTFIGSKKNILLSITKNFGVDQQQNNLNKQIAE